jgi:hypothetical protein
MVEKYSIYKIITLGIFFILIGTTATQVISRTTILSDVWEDTFNDATKIDQNPPGAGITDNYVVSGGLVTMSNTYPAWTDPGFTKMKPITLTNTGPIHQNYVLKLTIPYDSDMQSDFQDIRFKHEHNPTSWLSYWIEYKNTTTALVWVKIIYIPAGQSTLYLFYGNPSTTSQSNFAGVFPSWTKKWTNDVQISNQPDLQSAWDADIAYGSNRFLVTWEEGTGLPLYYQGIEGKIFDTNGNVLVNTFVIQEDPGHTYRYENPSADYGGGKYFVAYTYYDTPIDPSTQDVHARLVSTSGTPGSEIVVSSQTERQINPNVAFDSVNNRFCVVWEDARNGVSNYNLYAKLYDTSGTQIGSEKTICSSTHSQLEPWVAFDKFHSRYLIVWEDGVDASSGPFDIYAGLFDSNLNSIGSYTLVADGDSSIDYNWPTVAFSETTQRYLVTWNNDDISTGDYYGNIWGKIFDTNGNVVVNTFQISAGEYVRTDIAPYLSSSYMVTYDNGNKIYGKLISSTGELISSQQQICSNSATANWANTAVGSNTIFAGWEDKRLSSTYKYIFGNLFNLSLPSDTDITSAIGAEQGLVLSAHITSIAIQPNSLNLWDIFHAVFSGSITFDILDGSSGTILLSGVSSGTSLQSISAPSIRLKATLSRSNPSSSPSLDKWNVSWITNSAPFTPSNPIPTLGETGIDVHDTLSWTGGDPDGGDTVTYDVYFGTSTSPPLLVSNQTSTSYDAGTMNQGTTYYWKIIAWDNHHAGTSGPTWFFTTNYPPYQPSVPNPVNHATDIDVNADLSWTGGDPDSGDTVTYDVYFGFNNPPPKIMSNQSGTTYDPGTLLFLTTYYWKIVAWDNHDCTTAGPLWEFTTKFLPNHEPYEPSNPTPPNHAPSITIHTNLSWTGGDPDPTDTVTYDIYFGTTNPPPILAYGHPDTSYILTTLNYSTPYYWKIISWDNRGASTAGQIWDFTTMDEVNYPPDLPSDPNPENHAINVDIHTDIQWSGGDPNPTDTVTYDVYFGTTNPPPKITVNQTEVSYNPGILSFETTYFWKIVAWDNHHLSTAGVIWDFTTKQEVNYPPNAPSNPTPGNSATDVQVTVDLQWVGGDPNPSDTITYDVYFGTSYTPPKITDNQTSTLYDPGVLAYNTTYYWKIISWDNHGAITVGDLWSFTTETDTQPPTVKILKPENAIYLANTKLISFTVPVIIGLIDVQAEITDNQSGVDHVEFYLDDILKQNSSTTPFQWTWSDRGFFFYYLKIVAYDKYGNSATKEMKVWKFF